MGDAAADAVRVWRTHPSAWRPSCSITTRRAWTLISRAFDGADEGLTPRRRPGQRHAVLADQHRGLRGPSLLGEQASVLRAQGRQDPGRRERLPRRALPGAAELGRAGLPQARPLQPARPRAGTSPPGSSRDTSWTRSVQASGRSARQRPAQAWKSSHLPPQTRQMRCLLRRNRFQDRCVRDVFSVMTCRRAAPLVCVPGTFLTDVTRLPPISRIRAVVAQSFTASAGMNLRAFAHRSQRETVPSYSWPSFLFDPLECTQGTPQCASQSGVDEISSTDRGRAYGLNLACLNARLSTSLAKAVKSPVGRSMRLGYRRNSVTPGCERKDSTLRGKRRWGRGYPQSLRR